MKEGSELKKIREQLHAVGRQYRFGMKLHTLDFQLAMSQPHDDVIRSTRRDFKTRRQRFPLDNERMITARQKAVINSSKDRLPVMMNWRRLPMHQLRRTNHFTAKRLPDCLMTQTHTKKRNLSGKSRDDVERNTSIVRRARTGRNHDPLRTQTILDLVERDAIIPAHFNRFAQLTEILNQVVSKRIVI